MKRLFLGFFGLALAACGSPTTERPQETYSLVQALGNTENVAAQGLSKADCEMRRDELKQVAAALGTYNEATGHGSITCLPDSMM